MCYNQEELIAKAMDYVMLQKTNFKVEVVVGMISLLIIH